MFEILSKGAGILLLATLVACVKPAPEPKSKAKKTDAAPASTAQKAIELEQYGVRFLVPAHWRSAKQADGYVISGPKDSAIESSTLVFQAMLSSSKDGGFADFFALKQSLLRELKAKDGKVLRETAYQHNGISGVRLDSTFVHDKIGRRKDQLLFEKGPHILAFSYNASDKLFDKGHSVWAAALQSLGNLAPRKE